MPFRIRALFFGAGFSCFYFFWNLMGWARSGNGTDLLVAVVSLVVSIICLTVISSN